MEYWYLLREPENLQRLKTDREKELVKILKDGPRTIPELIEKMGLFHLNQLGAEELLRREIIGKAGLTPTDLLHVDGRFNIWNSEASKYGLAILGNYLNWEIPEMTEFIWSQTIEMIVKAIVEFLSEKKIPNVRGNLQEFGSWVFQNSLYPEHPQLETQIHLRVPMIGIGAPAEIMLPEVAKRLQCALILPDHYFVANAVGAISGSVMVSEEILVFPHLSPSGLDIISYYVQAREKREEFAELVDALAEARRLSTERAMNEALRSGADNPRVIVEELSEGLDTYRIRAQALGNPRLAK
jgi:N-methylhydantoinase A/oxoprolinase/acetone carboxylase beta subunit